MIEEIIRSMSTKTYDLPTPTEKQLKLMRTCDTCENRKSFNLVTEDKTIKANWCDEIYSYVKLNTIYLMCPFNKPHLKKKSFIERIMGW